MGSIPGGRRVARALPGWSATVLLVVAGGCATEQAARPEPGPAAAAPPTETPLGEPARVAARSEVVDEKTALDPDVEALLAPFAERVRARANRVVGTLSGPLEKAARDVPESTLGNFAADAMRASMGRNVGREIDVCFTNNGGLRRSLPAGEVTEGMLVELMPFENAIVVFEVGGARAREVLGRLVERGDPASGVSYERSDGKPVSLLIGGSPVDDGRIYSLCTNDYVFEGGGGYGLEDIHNPTYTGVLLRDAFIEAFENAQAEGRPIAPALDGRARDVGGAPSGERP